MCHVVSISASQSHDCSSAILPPPSPNHNNIARNCICPLLYEIDYARSIPQDKGSFHELQLLGPTLKTCSTLRSNTSQRDRLGLNNITSHKMGTFVVRAWERTSIKCLPWELIIFQTFNLCNGMCLCCCSEFNRFHPRFKLSKDELQPSFDNVCIFRGLPLASWTQSDMRNTFQSPCISMTQRTRVTSDWQQYDIHEQV